MNLPLSIWDLFFKPIHTGFSGNKIFAVAGPDEVKLIPQDFSPSQERSTSQQQWLKWRYWCSKQLMSSNGLSCILTKISFMPHSHLTYIFRTVNYLCVLAFCLQANNVLGCKMEHNSHYGIVFRLKATPHRDFFSVLPLLVFWLFF